MILFLSHGTSNSTSSCTGRRVLFKNLWTKTIQLRPAAAVATRTTLLRRGRRQQHQRPPAVFLLHAPALTLMIFWISILVVLQTMMIPAVAFTTTSVIGRGPPRPPSLVVRSVIAGPLFISKRRSLGLGRGAGGSSTMMTSSTTTKRTLSNYMDDFSSKEGSSSSIQPSTTDVVIQQTSLQLRRLSWFSWWVQVILTTISTVILIFARNVLGPTATAATKTMMTTTTLYRPHWFLSGLGLLTGGISIIWTWGNGWRLSYRLLRPQTTRLQVQQMLYRAIQIGIIINLFGLLIHLLAANEIVGNLAIRVFTNSPIINSGAGIINPSLMIGLQPLDILIVQANTNSLLSHFCSLVSLLWLTKRFPLLSVEK